MRVKRLVVVAGPPAAGKSTTISNISNGGVPALTGSLDLGDPRGWRVIRASELSRVREPQVDRVLLHYDFLRQWKRAGRVRYESDSALTILKSAADVTFVTLWAKPPTLTSRIDMRRAAIQTSGYSPLRFHAALQRRWRLRNMDRLGKLYADAPELSRHYDRWFQFCETQESRAHFVLDTSETESKLAAAGEWSAPAAGSD